MVSFCSDTQRHHHLCGVSKNYKPLTLSDEPFCATISIMLAPGRPDGGPCLDALLLPSRRTSNAALAAGYLVSDLIIGRSFPALPNPNPGDLPPPPCLLPPRTPPWPPATSPPATHPRRSFLIPIPATYLSFLSPRRRHRPPVVAAAARGGGV